MNIGLILSLVTIMTIILIFICHKWTYKFFNIYYVNLSIGIVMLSYFLIFRYIPDINLLIENKDSLLNGSIRLSLLYSKALLLDMCPLSFVLLSISLIFDKSRSTSKVIAPVALLGGIITIFGEITFYNQNDLNDTKWYEFIFVGTINNDGTISNRIYFFMHFFLIVMSLLVILNSKSYTRYSLYGTSLFYVFWFIYMQIIINTLNIKCNATGLVEFDWYYGQYSKVYEIYELDFPYIVIFWYIWALVFNYIVCLVRNLSIKNEMFLFENKWWYSNYKFLNKHLSKIDNWINPKINYLLKNKR